MRPSRHVNGLQGKQPTKLSSYGWETGQLLPQHVSGKLQQPNYQSQEGYWHLALAVLGVLVALLLLLQCLWDSLDELGIISFLRLKRGLDAVCGDPKEGVRLKIIQLMEEDVESDRKACQPKLKQTGAATPQVGADLRVLVLLRLIDAFVNMLLLEILNLLIELCELQGFPVK